MHDSSFQGEGVDGVSQQCENTMWSLRGMDLALSANSERLEAAGPPGCNYYEEKLFLLNEGINSEQGKAATNKQDLTFSYLCSREQF